MNKAASKEEVLDLINNNEMALVYFGGESCNVCTAVKPKIESMLKAYPEIRSIHVDVEKSIETAAFYNIFTIPAVLLFIEGKEIIREARYITIQDLDSKLKRYYDIFF